MDAYRTICIAPSPEVRAIFQGINLSGSGRVILGLLKPYVSFIQRAAEAPGAMRTHTIAVLLQWRANAHTCSPVAPQHAPRYPVASFAVNAFAQQPLTPVLMKTSVQTSQNEPSRGTFFVAFFFIHSKEQCSMMECIHRDVWL